MDDNENSVKNKDKVLERMRGKYPEDNFEDEEVLFGRIGEDYDENESRLSEYQAESDKLSEVMTKNPYSARFLNDLANGVNPWVSMVEQIGIEGITDMFENPDYKDDLAEAQKAYLDRLAKEQDLESQYEQNMDETLQMLQGMQDEEGLSDEDIDGAIDFLMQIVNDGIMGRFTRESVDMALKAIGYDSAVASAAEEGEIRGRNSRISEKLRKNTEGTDGIPTMGGANNTP